MLNATRLTTCARTIALITRTARQHGALPDAELLTAVYVDLTTTRQAVLQLESIAAGPSNGGLLRCSTLFFATPKRALPNCDARSSADNLSGFAPSRCASCEGLFFCAVGRSGQQQNSRKCLFCRVGPIEADNMKGHSRGQ
jgi:hypothetical protein